VGARLSKVAVRWLERYVQEQEPTLSDVALAVSALDHVNHLGNVTLGWASVPSLDPASQLSPLLRTLCR
jgi:hypothetical protein